MQMHITVATGDGSSPASIDKPREITNTGSGDLIMMFWTSELFIPQDTDSYPEDL